MKDISIAKEIDYVADSNYTLSICTLVTDSSDYQLLLNSFLKAGFNEKNCEFLFIDNSNNKYNAYSGINKFLATAKGKYIIICHQDIEIKYDNYEMLMEQIEFMNKRDNTWGVLGNAGNLNLHKFFMKITHPNNQTIEKGILPAKINTLDENFLVIKKEANIGLSSNLKGFHFYGTDICILANIRGYSCYAINFNILHKSEGKIDANYYKNKKELIHKYENALKSRFLRTTITHIFISSSHFLNAVMNTPLGLLFTKIIFKIKKEKAY
jgi:hypothetical protein